MSRIELNFLFLLFGGVAPLAPGGTVTSTAGCIDGLLCLLPGHPGAWGFAHAGEAGGDSRMRTAQRYFAHPIGAVSIELGEAFPEHKYVRKF